MSLTDKAADPESRNYAMAGLSRKKAKVTFKLKDATTKLVFVSVLPTDTLASLRKTLESDDKFPRGLKFAVDQSQIFDSSESSIEIADVFPTMEVGVACLNVLTSGSVRLS